MIREKVRRARNGKNLEAFILEDLLDGNVFQVPRATD
jgi:hypothetical protein